MRHLKDKFQEKSNGVSPAVGVILMVAITVGLAAVVGAAIFSFTDGGIGDETVRGGVDVQETPEGVEVTWSSSASSNADSIEVQVDGEPYQVDGSAVTLDNVGDRIVIPSDEASGKTVSAVAVDEEGNETVVSSQKVESSGSNNGSNTNTLSGTVEVNPVIPNATVKTLDSSGSVIDTTTTDENGEYSIEKTDAVSEISVDVDGTVTIGDDPRNSDKFYGSVTKSVSESNELNFNFDSASGTEIDVDGESAIISNNTENNSTEYIDNSVKIESDNSTSNTDAIQTIRIENVQNEKELDSISMNYSSFSDQSLLDSIDNENVEVRLSRQPDSGGINTSNITVNSADYTGESAELDLNGAKTTTLINHPSKSDIVVTIGDSNSKIKNPSSGDYDIDMILNYTDGTSTTRTVTYTVE